MKTLLAMPDGLQHMLFDAGQLRRLRDLAEISTAATVPDLSAASDELLSDVEVLVTGWGSAQIDAAALARMPALRAIVHTAGTVRSLVTDAVWSRPDLVVTTAAEANAVPVAEFTLAHVLLAGKQSLRREAEHRSARGRTGTFSIGPGGNYGAVVGLIGASRIGRLVAQMLAAFDLEVLISDPYVGEDAMAELGAHKVSLQEIFERADIVSLHAPDLPTTRGMVTAELLASMRDGTTFINTARPGLVDLDALRAEAVSGRISAVLDVHDDLDPHDPLWDVETVSITPHIAGSQGNELHRMGEYALEEVRRLRAGEAARFPVDRLSLDITA